MNAEAAMFAGIRYCTALTGPGDPRWQGRPDQVRAKRITALTDCDPRSGTRYFWDGGTRRRLNTPDAFRRLNQILG